MPISLDQFWLPIIGALALLLLVVWFLLRSAPDPYPYTAKPVLTEAERHFHATLRTTLPAGTLLLMKVRLADFLEVSVRGDAYLRHFGRISQKHTDFLLVDADTLAPLLAIELDDASHRHSARTQDSDAFKEGAYKAAGLPLLRVPLARRYDRARLRDAIREGLQQSA